MQNESPGGNNTLTPAVQQQQLAALIHKNGSGAFPAYNHSEDPPPTGQNPTEKHDKMSKMHLKMMKKMKKK